MERIKVGLVGFGTVGSSFYELIEKHKDRLKEQLGVEINITKVGVNNPRKHLNSLPAGVLLEGYEDILKDEKLPIIVELVGGVEKPLDLVSRALKAGKHVITANKALLSQHGDTLFRLARENGVELKFEASVGGGIPVIKVIRESLKGNEIESIMGILNGTTNFILTRMTEEKLTFKEALTEAQKLGFAEADPILDVEGVDAAQKISLLASISFRKWVDYREILCEGIGKVTKKDIEFAEYSGFVFKLIATAKMDKGRAVVTVFPALLPKSHPLASVREEYNGVLIKSDFLGTSMYLGRGAGGSATASSVASDLGDLIERIRMKALPDPVELSPIEKLELFPQGELSYKYFLHFVTDNKPGIWATVTGLLASNNINIESVQQKWEDPTKLSDLYILVDITKESFVRKAFREIVNSPGIHTESCFFRILED
ncbi:MAG: homoserine dehydrogenase [Spirochaetes bacterium]|nr:MAG: homoserine dehydrogenase [Spirochaetota bacterium]